MKDVRYEDCAASLAEETVDRRTALDQLDDGLAPIGSIDTLELIFGPSPRVSDTLASSAP